MLASRYSTLRPMLSISAKFVRILIERPASPLLAPSGHPRSRKMPKSALLPGRCPRVARHRPPSEIPPFVSEFCRGTPSEPRMPLLTLGLPFLASPGGSRWMAVHGKMKFARIPVCGCAFTFNFGKRGRARERRNVATDWAVGFKIAYARTVVPLNARYRMRTSCSISFTHYVDSRRVSGLRAGFSAQAQWSFRRGRVTAKNWIFFGRLRVR